MPATSERSVQTADKTHKPIASVAAFPERHAHLQIPTHSVDRTGSRICHCEEAAGRRGNLGEAPTISPVAFLQFNRVLRDCRVASLLAMTRQVVPWCTSGLLPLNAPPAGRSGNAAADAIGAFHCNDGLRAAAASSNNTKHRPVGALLPPGGRAKGGRLFTQPMASVR